MASKYVVRSLDWAVLHEQNDLFIKVKVMRVKP